MDDFVRVGGLAAVSAALPRALRRWSDVRILLPGYRDVVEQFTHIQIVGQCAGAGGNAGLLARAGSDQGRSAGLRPALSATLRPPRQSLWRRLRPRLAGQRRALRPICLGRGPTRGRHSGQELGSGSGSRQRLAGRAGAGLPRLERGQDSHHPDHPQPGLSGSVSEGVAAPDRRARAFLSYRRPRILRQAVLPQGRHRLRFASDHRQRDLCQGDHHAGTRLRARGSASPPLRRRAADGNTERHRRKLGSAGLRPAGAAVRRGRLGRQARQRRLRPPAIRPGVVARSDFRSGGPARSSERRRPRPVRRRRDHRGRRPDRRRPAAASPRSSRRWSMRIAAGPMRSGSPSVSTTARRGGFSPAAILR